MSALLLAALTASATALLVPASSRARLAGLRSAQPARRSPARLSVTPAVAAAGLVGLGVLLLVDGPLGVVAGAVVAVALARLLARLEPRAVRQRRERVVHDLPIAVDLLASCLLVGRQPSEALRAVASAIGGPLAHDLGVLATRLRLGSDPVTVWREVSVTEPLGPLGRAMARSLETGAPLADGLTRLADDLRRTHRAAVEQRARSVGVRAAAPLGLCFLPAFVLIGIVPTIVGAFASMQLW
ncbi:MAG TPA: type II secretion system F family protein [Nocardioidaceae bacterium]|nr:type II secretion system F family protein [Actinomycetota bacterium]HEV8056758.1 type II secretion system F family protein [Nocardioidaceae bacterium]